jgi:uncharacterized damage-inducible protein DinB
MKTEIEKLTSLLKRTFDKGAWHGPTVTETLQGVTAANAFNRLPNTHSIIELVGHMTAWRTYVAKKLMGDDSFTVTDELNFPAGTNWEKTLKGLEESQRQLLTAIEKFPEEKLSALVIGVDDQYTYYTLINGIIHHDTYHTGQIKLITKATV